MLLCLNVLYHRNAVYRNAVRVFERESRACTRITYLRCLHELIWISRRETGVPESRNLQRSGGRTRCSKVRIRRSGHGPLIRNFTGIRRFNDLAAFRISDFRRPCRRAIFRDLSSARRDGGRTRRETPDPRKLVGTAEAANSRKTQSRRDKIIVRTSCRREIRTFASGLEANEPGACVRLFPRETRTFGHRVFPPMDFFTRTYYIRGPSLPRILYRGSYTRRGFLFDFIIGNTLVTSPPVPSAFYFSAVFPRAIGILSLRSFVIFFIPHQSSGTDRNDAIEWTV